MVVNEKDHERTHAFTPHANFMVLMPLYWNCWHLKLDMKTFRIQVGILPPHTKCNVASIQGHIYRRSIGKSYRNHKVVESTTYVPKDRWVLTSTKRGVAECHLWRHCNPSTKCGVGSLAQEAYRPSLQSIVLWYNVTYSLSLQSIVLWCRITHRPSLQSIVIWCWSHTALHYSLLLSDVKSHTALPPIVIWCKVSRRFSLLSIALSCKIKHRPSSLFLLCHVRSHTTLRCLVKSHTSIYQ